MVEEVQGRAAEAGIQPGDVVLSVDGTPVQTVAQLRKMVKDHDKQIALLIQRGDVRLFVPVTLGQSKTLGLSKTNGSRRYAFSACRRTALPRKRNG